MTPGTDSRGPRVAVLPGDGIGVEVTDAACSVLERMDLELTLEHGRIGWECWTSEGDPVPPATWQLLERSDACLLGAVTSKPAREARAELSANLDPERHSYVSPVVQLRQRLDLFANVRPITDLSAGRFAFCVIRENTEGLYAGFDAWPADSRTRALVSSHPNVLRSSDRDVAVAMRLTTGHGLDRILQFAFAYAVQSGAESVTVADKPNVLRHSGAFLSERVEAAATRFPSIKWELLNADAVAMWMIRKPQRFGVIVAENMFGDVLSDVGAGMMGGLGLAPSGNHGDHFAYFEPVHGSAPRLVGEDRANPMAMLLSLAALLDHVGRPVSGRALRLAVRDVLREGTTVTWDLGGAATTAEVADAVASALLVPGSTAPAQAAVITVGDELLDGTVTDTNSTDASERLIAAGYQVCHRSTVGDSAIDIMNAVSARLGRDRAIIVIGGLGPTSDDVTRSAVASAVSRELAFDDNAWTALTERMRARGLHVHESNRKQALFPRAADVLPNPNGTARGFVARVDASDVIVLPGPPNECLPMLDRYLLAHPASQESVRRVTWRLLGVIESDVADQVDRLIASYPPAPLRAHYRWTYPYVDVSVDFRGPLSDEIEGRIDTALASSTVTKDGGDAFDALQTRLAPTQPVAAMLSFGAAQFASGLRRVGVLSTESFDEAAVRVVGRCGFNRSASLTATLTATVSVHDSVTEYGVVVPDRGEELAHCAAAFYAWSLVRALNAQAGIR